MQAPDAYGETEHGHPQQSLCWLQRPSRIARPAIHYERRADLPEHGAPFAGPAPTTGVHAIGWNPVNTAIGHKSQAPDLEPIAQTDPFDALPFREGLDLGHGEDDSAPVGGQTCDFGLQARH